MGSGASTDSMGSSCRSATAYKPVRHYDECGRRSIEPDDAMRNQAVSIALEPKEIVMKPHTYFMTLIMTAPLITSIVNLGGCCGRARPFMAWWREIISLLSKRVSARNPGSKSLYAPHYYSHLDDNNDHHRHIHSKGWRTRNYS